MMIVVKDPQGRIIAFGEDNGGYAPTVPDGCTLELVADEDFVAQKPTPKVTTVSVKQFMLALANQGIYELAEQAVQTAPIEVKILWNKAATFERNNSYLIQFAKSAPFSMSDEQLDALFELANTL